MSQLIYLIAGEPSGDALGARLMAGLKEATGGDIRFAGIGGALMRAEGLDSLFPMAELSVMGLVEVLPRIPNILRRVKQTLADIGQKAPDAVLTIDSWGFTGRVQRGVRRRFPAIARIHYVAPMVWAWRPKRAGELAKVLDLLLTLLPFEPPWFEKEGLKAVHVGHPVIESGLDKGDGPAFRRRHGIAADASVLLVLPGSRRSETGQMLPVFGAALDLLARKHPGLTVVVPTVETVTAPVRAAAADWPVPTVVIEGRAEKADAFAAATAAMAASGTVSLELALARVPTVIAYRVAPLTAFLATRLLGLRVKFATLVNVVMNAPVMPELLQKRCRSDLVAAAVDRLLTDEHARSVQIAASAAGLRLLAGDGHPGQVAAEAVLAHLRNR